MKPARFATTTGVGKAGVYFAKMSQGISKDLLDHSLIGHVTDKSMHIAAQALELINRGLIFFCIATPESNGSA